MLQITDFNMPEQHPYGMLEGYKHAAEKEATLATVLRKNIIDGSFAPVKTIYDHIDMVEDGLLEDVDGKYALTKKAKGLLYSVYGKED